MLMLKQKSDFADTNIIIIIHSVSRNSSDNKMRTKLISSNNVDNSEDTDINKSLQNSFEQFISESPKLTGHDTISVFHSVLMANSN